LRPCFYATAAVFGDKVRSFFGALEWEAVGNHRSRVQSAVFKHLNCLACAPVLPPHVLYADFLAPHGVHLERNALRFWDADEEQLAARFQ
jgi:hypothetical protein